MSKIEWPSRWKRVLLINNFRSGGAKEYADVLFARLRRKGIDVKYIQHSSFNVSWMPYNVWRLLAAPFVALREQLRHNYDVVISNQSFLIPIGKNPKCEYVVTLHHSAKDDLNVALETKAGFVEYVKMFAYWMYEIFMVMSTRKVGVVSSYTLRRALKLYVPFLTLVFLPVSHNRRFRKYRTNKRYSILLLPSVFSMPRKGATFITPILIKLRKKILKRGYVLIVTNKIAPSMRREWRKLQRAFGAALIHIPNPSPDELGRLYASSACVLHPSLIEGYGMVPLEVADAGGFCISTPVPSVGYDNELDGRPGVDVINKHCVVIGRDKALWKAYLEGVIENGFAEVA